ncbi:MAG TPA: pseudaminic acid synthase [Candidatus Mucispirillum faecigallinarum]|uniref:Pseudaminic acid synthase n=1 Tax=Candidatus Mucispirillum faecigallinarum TaxID=2838699 RepID=A0A9D2GRS8_9BACT|nr:pseudaminic acid synthase [Candidatus Mucispirillum faecigallinarum]
MKIADFEIGKDKTFIIAELSANHNGSLEIAVETIKAAAKAGADAVKLQTYRADTITLNSRDKNFVINNDSLWDGLSYYQLYDKAHTPWQWHKTLKDVAEKLGLILFSSPFDKTAVDYLEELNVPAYKIASFEINDLPLIEYVAKKNKPVIISTGVATYDEIEDAVNTCRKSGNNDIILLKCTSSYPAPIEEANLLMIKKLSEDFNCITGLSDHTLNNVTAIAAVSLGANVIEKHFILDKSINSPDAAFSLDENEFKKLVDDIRLAEKSLGKIDYSISKSVLKNRHFMRSLYVIKDIAKGDKFTSENIGSFRPNLGISPKYYSDIIGKKAACDIKANTPLKNELIDKGE